MPSSNNFSDIKPLSLKKALGLDTSLDEDRGIIPNLYGFNESRGSGSFVPLAEWDNFMGEHEQMDTFGDLFGFLKNQNNDSDNSTENRFGVNRDDVLSDDYDSFLKRRLDLGETKEQADANYKELTGKNPPSTNSKNTTNGFPFLNPYGLNLESRAYLSGKAFGSKDYLTGTLAGTDFLLGAARSALSGFGYGRANRNANQEYRRKQFSDNRRNYTPNPQTNDVNNLGGIKKFGGTIDLPMTKEDFEMLEQFRNELPLRRFEEGGSLDEVPEGFLEEVIPNKQEEVQDYEADAMEEEELVSQVIDYLQQGVSPQDIIEALTMKGFDANSAEALVVEAVRFLEQQQPASNDVATEEVSENEGAEESMTMKNGGKFSYKVGDYIKFKHGGRMVEGYIKSIDSRTGKFTI